jgi:hypothetical protein
MTTSIESAAATLRAPGIEFEFDDRRLSTSVASTGSRTWTDASARTWSRPDRWRWPTGTVAGSKLPLRSRGIFTATSPISVRTVLG